jgi:predicted RNA methylase
MKKSTGLKRNNNEQYYTQQRVADNLISRLQDKLNLHNFDFIVEPSAGTGVFIQSLQRLGLQDRIVAYDIEPKHPDILLGNYLEQIISPCGKKYIVVGNPPFGRQGGLAKKFIKHSCSFARVIAFILPRSFKKESMYRCFDLAFHKMYEEELEENSFIFEDASYSVPCVFQVWEKRDYLRNVSPIAKENELYKIVKRDSEPAPNMAFRRVGVYAGKFIFDNIGILSIESHYFVHLKIPIKMGLQKSLESIQWETNNTTGPRSISKQELIVALNRILK